MEQVSLMMAGAQLGITICSLGLGAVGEPAVAHLLERPFAAAGRAGRSCCTRSRSCSRWWSCWLHIVLGEMVPKNIALAGPDRAALLLGPPLCAVVRLLRPVIVALNALSNAALRLLRVDPKSEVASAYPPTRCRTSSASHADEGLLDEDEHQLLTGALRFEERTASAVTLPADRLVTVTPQATAGELRELCVRTGFSRFPVVDGDDLAGYVHVKDLAATDRYLPDGQLPPSLVRPLATVSAHSPLHDVLATMQAGGAHMGRVEDGRGQAVGVVALEDVLEELVGEVQDATRASSDTGG